MNKRFFEERMKQAQDKRDNIPLPAPTIAEYMEHRLSLVEIDLCTDMIKFIERAEKK